MLGWLGQRLAKPLEGPDLGREESETVSGLCVAFASSSPTVYVWVMSQHCFKTGQFVLLLNSLRPPHFDIDAVYGPAMHLVDLIWNLGFGLLRGCIAMYTTLLGFIHSVTFKDSLYLSTSIWDFRHSLVGKLQIEQVLSSHKITYIWSCIWAPQICCFGQVRSALFLFLCCGIWEQNIAFSALADMDIPWDEKRIQELSTTEKIRIAWIIEPSVKSSPDGEALGAGYSAVVALISWKSLCK